MRLYRGPLRPLFLLWWRLRERDVDDLGWPPAQTDTYGSPDYKYGKVTGLVPDLRVITETSESPYVCCGYCSAGMACWTAKSGITHSMSGAAHPIRSNAGRPHDNGSKASELRNGARGAHGVTFDALARDEIPDVLRDGFAVVINLDYADLPSYLKVQSGSFGHSCCLYGWKEDGDYVGFFDPLWPEGASGAWAKWADVKPALWADGEHSGTVKSTRPPEPEPEPPPPPIYVDPYVDERAAYARGVRDGVASEGDRVFRSWAPGRLLDPADMPPGGRWDVSSWASTPEPIGEPWAGWPLPLDALWRAQEPAEWRHAGWAASVWRG